MAWKNTGFSLGEPNSYLLTRIITLFVQVRRWAAPPRPGRPEGTKSILVPICGTNDQDTPSQPIAVRVLLRCSRSVPKVRA